MTRKIRITPKALNDIQEAINYYNGQQKGLGRRFQKNVDKYLSKIQKMPQSATIAFDNVRYKVVDSFPYIITYEFNDQNIIILRVFNTQLNPEKL